MALIETSYRTTLVVAIVGLTTLTVVAVATLAAVGLEAVTTPAISTIVAIVVPTVTALFALLKAERVEHRINGLEQSERELAARIVHTVKESEPEPPFDEIERLADEEPTR